MKSAGRARILAPGGGVIAGLVLCLLLTAVYGNPPTRHVIKATPANSSVSLNNSVVASASTQEQTSEAPCTGDDCASSNKSSEELVSLAKGPVTSGDPLVRTNHIGLARYAAGSIADEIEERVRADLENRPGRTNSTYSPATTSSGNSYNGGDNSSRNAADDIEERVRADIAKRYELIANSSNNSAIIGRYASNNSDTARRYTSANNNDSASAADAIEQRIRVEMANRPKGNTNNTGPEPDEISKYETASNSFDDRLRRLSAAVSHNVDNSKKLKDLNISTTRSEIQSAESDPAETEVTRDIWLVPSGSNTEETPSLPDTYSRVAGFISTVSYDETAKPSQYRMSSTKTIEDDTATAFTSTNHFAFSESIKPSINPSSVTLVLTTSGGYDRHDSGSSDDDDDDDDETPETEAKEASTSENKETTVSTNNNTIIPDPITSATNTTVQILDLKNKTEVISNDTSREEKTPEIRDDLTNINDIINSNKTEISSKLSFTEKDIQNKKENESLSKNVTEVSNSKDESTSTVTVSQSVSTRRRLRPSSTTVETPTVQEAPSTARPTVQSRGSTKFSTMSDTPRFAATERSTTRASFTPSATTFRGRPSTRRGSSTTSTTTPIPDAVGAETSLECTTTEETLETTFTPEEEGNTVTYRTTVRSRTTSKSRTPIRGRFSSTVAPNDTSASPAVTEISWSTNTSDWEEVSTLEPGVTETSSSSAGDEDEYLEVTSEPSTNSSTSSTTTTQSNTTPIDSDSTTTLASNVKAFLRLTVATSWEELCRDQELFRQGLAALLSRGIGREISSDRVILLNDEQCLEPPDSTSAGIPLHVYLEDERGRYDMELTESFPQVWGKDPSNDLQITCVDLRYTKDEQVAPATAENANIIAAIAISGVAAGCLLLLIILMLVMRKRQKRTTYGQRCTPVSLDAYSLDSVSVYNSVRRKGHLRASKRSYGNPAFDDPDSPSHPVNFAGLANCVGDTSALHEEFALVPVIPARMDDLPPGADAKNRYSNIIPLPETRVPLSRKGSDSLSEYINANYIRGPKNAPKYYIACQAPLESTVPDFWRMIWEQQSKVILMLTDLEENGVEKCADYMPPSEVLDCHRRFGDFHVTLKKREVRDKYIVSTLQLKNMESSLWREITHLWYFGWPATGVPEEASAVITFISEARAFMKSNPGPTVVHCSPGTGRTGTVLAIDLCIRDFEQSRLVDVPRVVSRLRRDRAGAVQTRDQYVFIYQVLNIYAAKLTGGAMDSF